MVDNNPIVQPVEQNNEELPRSLYYKFRALRNGIEVLQECTVEEREALIKKLMREHESSIVTSVVESDTREGADFPTRE